MIRPRIVGMQRSNSYGHTTTAMREYRVHPLPCNVRPSLPPGRKPYAFRPGLVEMRTSMVLLIPSELHALFCRSITRN